MAEKRQPRALIVGGSMAGLFAGLILRRSGWDVDVFERTEGPLSGRGAGILTHPELHSALDAVGLPPGADFGVPIEMRVALGRNDETLAELAYPQIATSWTRVHAMLAKAFPADRYHAGVDFAECHAAADGVTARFANGRQETADVLIGADGLRSSVRRCLFPDLAPDYAGYVAWRGLLPEADVDGAPFEQSSLFAINLPPGEHMVGYPVAGLDDDLRPGKRRYNFVWYRPADAATELPKLMTDRYGQQHALSIPPNLIAPDVVAEMRLHSASVLAPWFQRVVSRTAQPFLQPIYDLAVPRMAVGRVALIGDAAFVVRPHVGAGVVKAADDATALAAALSAGGADAVTALESFSINRHAVGVKMIDRARWLGSYLHARFDSEEARGAALKVGTPANVLAETAVLDFLHAKP